MNVDIEEQQLYDESFGLWITGFFGNISAFCHQKISFDVHKQIFFELLEKWLESGKVVFCPPESPLTGVWNESSDKIIGYLKSRWPVHSAHKNDSDLNYYFHEIPAILWVKPDGTLVGS